MKVAERLALREDAWRELDLLVARFESGKVAGPAASGRSARYGLTASELIHLAALYRSACSDLMLAEAHDLPRETVAYLHSLVGRAHNVVYRGRGFRFSAWAGSLLDEVPSRLRKDPTLRLAGAIFFGTFLVFAFLCAARPEVAQQLLGEVHLAQMEEMYEQVGPEMERNDAAMAGFYVRNNAGIGLVAFAFGLTFAIGTIWILFSNALILGSTFGYMATTPQAANFYTFVTAHGPFELTAIVFSGAAGIRMGWGLIETQGQPRIQSLQREARKALPIAGCSVVLFVLAAMIEGFVSASALPYWAKAAIAIVSAALLISYVALGGRRRAISVIPASPQAVA